MVAPCCRCRNPHFLRISASAAEIQQKNERKITALEKKVKVSALAAEILKKLMPYYIHYILVTVESKFFYYYIFFLLLSLYLVTMESTFFFF